MNEERLRKYHHPSFKYFIYRLRVYLRPIVNFGVDCEGNSSNATHDPQDDDESEIISLN